MYPSGNHDPSRRSSELRNRQYEAFRKAIMKAHLHLAQQKKEAFSLLCFRQQSQESWQALSLGSDVPSVRPWAVIMVAGNQPRMPKGLLQGVRTMTANIVTEMGYASGLHREALIATGVVLFVFILIINLSLSLLNRRAEYAN